jgi:hypothetical protein
MRIWTVHEPRHATSEQERVDRAVFVKDGFSWLAFLFSLPWLLFHRLWLGALIYVLASAATMLAGGLLTLEAWAGVLLGLIPGLYAGFEGNDLRRRKLARLDFAQVASLSARTQIEAETDYFGLRTPVTAPAAASVNAPAPRRTTMPHDTDVLGLFPQPQVRR